MANAEGIRVLIVDEHKVLAETLATFLQGKPDVAVARIASSAEEALQFIEEWEPSVILMDIALPGMDGIHATQLIKRTHPEIGIVMLTMYADEDHVCQAMEFGADGYILKDFTSDFVVHAVLAVARGEAFLDPASTKKVVGLLRAASSHKQEGSAYQPSVSRREREILKMLCAGLSNKQRCLSG